jgi:hypothetical protein
MPGCNSRANPRNKIMPQLFRGIDKKTYHKENHKLKQIISVLVFEGSNVKGTKVGFNTRSIL